MELKKKTTFQDKKGEVCFFSLVLQQNTVKQTVFFLFFLTSANGLRVLLTNDSLKKIFRKKKEKRLEHQTFVSTENIGTLGEKGINSDIFCFLALHCRPVSGMC